MHAGAATLARSRTGRMRLRLAPKLQDNGLSGLFSRDSSCVIERTFVGSEAFEVAASALLSVTEWTARCTRKSRTHAIPAPMQVRRIQ
jgi:hypothetical protein